MVEERPIHLASQQTSPRPSSGTPTSSSLANKKDVAYGVRREIGRNIRRARVKQGITQKEMADYFNANESYYRGVEHGIKEYSLIRLCEIAWLLRVQLSDLVEGV